MVVIEGRSARSDVAGKWVKNVRSGACGAAISVRTAELAEIEAGAAFLEECEPVAEDADYADGAEVLGSEVSDEQ